MWFKARAGLVSLVDPFQIEIAKAKGPPPYWYIYARSTAQQEGTMRGFMGRAQFSNPITYLAMFAESDAVQRDIGKCMVGIEAAIKAESSICDLSDVGDAAIWPATWNLVQWEQRG